MRETVQVRDHPPTRSTGVLEMAKVQHCHQCQRELSAQQKTCACGEATGRMSFAERTAWEVQQWRAYKSRQLEVDQAS
jgi:hypothetical protein